MSEKSLLSTIIFTGGSMGKKDITLKDYLSDRRRYADLINGSIFRGEQIVCAEDLTEANAVQTRVHNGADGGTDK